MGAFASMADAEARAREKTADGTWTVAHAQRGSDGTIGVRVLRPTSLAGYDASDPTADGTNKAGAWDTLTDDAAE